MLSGAHLHQVGKWSKCVAKFRPEQILLQSTLKYWSSKMHGAYRALSIVDTDGLVL